MTQANRAFYSELYKDNTQHQTVDVLLYNEVHLTAKV